MIDHTKWARALGFVLAVLVTAAIAAPLAAADPQTRYLPGYAAPSPGLGEHLTGADRSWLALSPSGEAPRLGEQLSGADRGWLEAAPSSTGGAPPAGNFDWDDAGIGAGAAVAAVSLLVAGTMMLIRGRASPAH